MHERSNNQANVFITGASRGLGQALALNYARDGARLGILARKSGDLAVTARLCDESGASAVRTYSADVRDQPRVTEALTDFSRDALLDTVFANAGTLRPHEGLTLDHEVFEVNFYGCVNTVAAALNIMMRQHRGVIVVTSSFSAFRGVPSVPSYAAAKAAVHNYAESMRNRVAHLGIAIKTATLGYLNTEIADGNARRFLPVTDVTTAAERLRKLAASSAPTLKYPPSIAWMYRLVDVLPPRLYDLLLKHRFASLTSEDPY